MPYQNISSTLSAADITAINAAIQTIRQKMPFLVTLTTTERKRLFKFGPRSEAFVENAQNAAAQHPNILPATFNVAEFNKDVELLGQLGPVFTTMKSLCSDVEDTYLAVGGETMQEGVQVYEYVKAAAKTTPGLKPIADQLGERFKRAQSGGSPPPPPNP